MINASRWGKNEKIVLKGLSEHFSEKICCKRGEEVEGKELVNKSCQKFFQSLVVMEATITRDRFVMCNVKKA